MTIDSTRVTVTTQAMVDINNILALFSNLQSVTDQFIQDEVKRYNVANNTTYQNIDSFTKYTFDNTKARYAVAISFLDWSDSVWDKVVVIRDKFLVDKIEPTEEDFIAQLPLKQ